MTAGMYSCGSLSGKGDAVLRLYRPFAMPENREQISAGLSDRGDRLRVS